MWVAQPLFAAAVKTDMTFIFYVLPITISILFFRIIRFEFISTQKRGPIAASEAKSSDAKPASDRHSTPIYSHDTPRAREKYLTSFIWCGISKSNDFERKTRYFSNFAKISDEWNR